MEIVWALYPLAIKEERYEVCVGLGGAQMRKAECYEELVSSDLNNLKLTTVFPLPFGTAVREGRQMPKNDVS